MRTYTGFDCVILRSKFFRIRRHACISELFFNIECFSDCFIIQYILLLVFFFPTCTVYCTSTPNTLAVLACFAWKSRTARFTPDHESPQLHAVYCVVYFLHIVFFFLSVDSWHISWFLALRHLPLLEIFLTKTLLSKLTDKIATVQQPADMIWTLLVCFWQRLSAFWVCSCKPSSPVNDICALDNMLKRTAL